MQRLRNRILRAVYHAMDGLYLRLERGFYTRNRYLQLVPGLKYRRGGTMTLTEWGFTIGLFQGLICRLLPNRTDRRLLDVGCGSGRLAIAASSCMSETDKYVGLEISRPDYEFCKYHYRGPKYTFAFVESHNPAYSPSPVPTQPTWPIEDQTIDLVTALSVWTHLDERDAGFYLREVSRVLKQDGKAIITFFILDDLYRETVAIKDESISEYYPQPRNKWIFDQASYGSSNWYHPSWTQVPEAAIAVEESALIALINAVGLSICEVHKGSWRDAPGMFFQDILVLEKAGT
jgi:SAM-dependent methyltransferase